MKRLICILFAGLLLWSMAIAEDPAELNGIEDCDHQFQVEGMLREDQLWYIEESDAEPELFQAVRCVKCGAEGIVFDERSLLEPDPCGQDECYHRLYVLPEFGYSTWKSAEDIDGHTYHERYEYCVGVCIDCNLVTALFEIAEKGEHQMAEKQGFHIEGQYIHVTCKECLLCGMMNGELVPCIAYEDGSCDRTR